MNVRDLVPWSRNTDRNRNLATSRETASPLLTLHREMNRLFDDVFSGLDHPAPWGGRGWPHLEVEETETDYRITAELAGLEEKDIELLVQDGVLILRGEKRAENHDRDRAFSERIYGRFERRIALEGADEAGVKATFRNGVLTVTVPKSAQSRERVRRIAINGSGAAH
jgi:HSP20 family protein